jgi:hypothetical protein
VLPSKSYYLQEWVELFRGHVLDCARLAAWLTVEMAGEHIQLKMDHASGNYEWALYYHVIPSPGERDDPKREIVAELAKKFLEEIEE